MGFDSLRDLTITCSVDSTVLMSGYWNGLFAEATIPNSASCSAETNALYGVQTHTEYGVPYISGIHTIFDDFGDPVGMICTFADGTTEKAIVNREYDTFSYETGITVCLCKKLMGGSKAYNKYIHKAIKDDEARWDALYEQKRKELEQREIRKRRHEKARRKREQKEAAKREAEIQMQAEAYARALRMAGIPTTDDGR